MISIRWIASWIENTMKPFVRFVARMLRQIEPARLVDFSLTVDVVGSCQPEKRRLLSNDCSDGKRLTRDRRLM